MPAKKTKARTIPTRTTQQPPVFATGADAMRAVLIVSLLFNAFVFCLWLALQFTSKYDSALADLFFNR